MEEKSYQVDKMLETLIDLASDEVAKAKQRGYFGKDFVEAACDVIELANQKYGGTGGYGTPGYNTRRGYGNARGYGDDRGYGHYEEYDREGYGTDEEYHGTGEYDRNRGRKGERYGRSGERYG